MHIAPVCGRFNEIGLYIVTSFTKHSQKAFVVQLCKSYNKLRTQPYTRRYMLCSTRSNFPDFLNLINKVILSMNLQCFTVLSTRVTQYRLTEGMFRLKRCISNSLNSVKIFKLLDRMLSILSA